jgi:hypothetical protein
MSQNLFFTVLLAASFLSDARGDETNPIVPESPVPARLIGDIPEGTRPPPERPKEAFVIPAVDILETESHRQGGRIITFQQVRPLPLPPEPVDAALLAEVDPSALQERLAEYRARFPKFETLGLGATVYRSAGSPPRTLLTWWPRDQSGPVSVWSSADFALVAGGIHEFMGTDGVRRRLFVLWSEVDLDRRRELFAARGKSYPQREIPVFPTGPAAFVAAGRQAPEELVVALTSLHSVYHQELPRLIAARESREQQRRIDEADRAANPPVPQDITVSYWHSEGPAPEKGGDR